MLASVHAAWPETRIGWVVQEEFADIVASHPALAQVVPFPRTKFRGAWRSPGRAVSAGSWLRSLRSGNWEIAIDCQGLARSGLFAQASGARRRVGFADAREMGWMFLNDRVRTSERHTVDRMMSLVDALEIPRVQDMRLYAPPNAMAWWRENPDRPSGRYVQRER